MNREVILQKDYSYIYNESDEESRQNDQLLEALGDAPVIQNAFARHHSNPHMLNLICKKAFDRMVKEADAFTEDFGGTIVAFIDYETYDAKIDMVLPFFDMSTIRQKCFFMRAMALTTYIDVSPAPDEKSIRIRLSFPLFTELSDKEQDRKEAAAIRDLLREMREQFDGSEMG